MCIYQRFTRNLKFTNTKKNGGNIPPVYDNRTLWVPIPCGNCIECRQATARDWMVRLNEDIQQHTNGQMVTLKFSNEGIKQIDNYITKNQPIPLQPPTGYARDNAIAKTAVRMFLERWRKKYKKSLRHWLVTELGHKGTENIHMHGILWTDNWQDISKIWNSAKDGEWGFIWDGYTKNEKRLNYVNEKTISYTCKYITKMDLQHQYYKSKIFASPGIGKYYIDRNGNSKYNNFNYDKTNQCYTTRTGHKIKLPKYLRYKIYTDKERELLWINQMNKEKIYVLGQQIDVSKNYDEYLRAIEYARKLNAQIGYGTNMKNWIRELEENKRRDWQLQKRIQNGALRAEIHSCPPLVEVGQNDDNTQYTPSEGGINTGYISKTHVANENNTKINLEIPINNSILANYLNNKNKQQWQIKSKWQLNPNWD